ncbi:TldD/PmbA family protein [Candidatus Woesearchaeota archaeon]|nr:TldD/PmbA family protein [Candidatus Woesearchaeota archaeon]
MEETADYVLKLCSDCDYAEVRLENLNEEGFVLKNSTVDVAAFSEAKGLAVRVLVNGSLGFVSTDSFDKSDIKKSVMKAIKIARAGKKLISQPITFSDEKMSKDKIIITPKKKHDTISHEQKIAYLKIIDKNLLELPFKVPARQLSFSTLDTKKLYVNSEGARIRSEFPRTEAFWFITVAEKQKTKQRYLSYNQVKGLEALDEWKLDETVVSEAKALHNNLAKGQSPPTGEMDIVVGPEVVGIAVHESTGHPYEADRILGREAAQAGESFVTPGMIGTKIGSDIVNVSEDPTLPGSSGFYLYDDEGVKARKRRLILNGNINEFLQNRQTASVLGVKSNASARAVTFEREPIVRMANTFMEPGDWGWEEIINETKKGIYIKNFMEWNIDDKRYNQKYVGAEAYLIENGEITAPVVNPAIEVTTPAFYSSINAIAKDVQLFAGTCGKGEPMQGIPVSMGGPTIRLSGLRVR